MRFLRRLCLQCTGIRSTIQINLDFVIPADPHLLDKLMHDHLFRLHAAHLKQFGPVLSAKELTNAIDSAPAWWDNDNQSKHNAIFVIPPANAASIIEAVGKATPEYEKVTHSGPMLFWPAPINTFSRTRWSNVVSATGLYHSITIQNANTAKRLVRLVKGE